MYLSSRIRFTNTVYTISLFPLMNNAAFVSFLAHVSAHDSLFASTEFLAQRFIHCFADYSLLLFVLYPTICIFRSVETFSLSLSLSFSCVFAYFFSPVYLHTVENRTHVRSPPSISLSLLLRQVNAKANVRRTLCIYIYIYTCWWKHTRAFDNVSVHRRLKGIG